MDQTRFGVVFLIEDPLGQDPFHSPSGDDDEDSEVFPAGTKGQERLTSEPSWLKGDPIWTDTFKTI